MIDRDELAARAMVALIEREWPAPYQNLPPPAVAPIAAAAYAFAAAMIAARSPGLHCLATTGQRNDNNVCDRCGEADPENCPELEARWANPRRADRSSSQLPTHSE